MSWRRGGGKVRRGGADVRRTKRGAAAAARTYGPKPLPRRGPPKTKVFLNFFLLRTKMTIAFNIFSPRRGGGKVRAHVAAAARTSVKNGTPRRRGDGGTDFCRTLARKY